MTSNWANIQFSLSQDVVTAVPTMKRIFVKNEVEMDGTKISPNASDGVTSCFCHLKLHKVVGIAGACAKMWKWKP